VCNQFLENLNRHIQAAQAQLSESAALAIQEAVKATLKFPTWPNDPIHALAVLGEEFGELTKDVLQLTYEPHKTNLENVRTEAIQTAAMALRFLASVDAYKFKRSEQHEQPPID
jgi:hypothetical protein